MQVVLVASGEVPKVHTVQAEGVVIDPPTQTEPASITHVEFHPSPFATLLSSHSSVACCNPSPQITTQLSLAAFGEVPDPHNMHVSALVVDPPEQAYPASITHAPSHPSPATVPPSSHCSVACLSPSPQTALQAVCPAFGVVPPVHTLQVLAVVKVPPLQIPLASILQVLSHPSKLRRFPSSHPSDGTLKPSPQFIWHTVPVGSGEVPPVQTVHVSIVVKLPPTQIELGSI